MQKLLLSLRPARSSRSSALSYISPLPRPQGASSLQALPSGRKLFRSTGPSTFAQAMSATAARFKQRWKQCLGAVLLAGLFAGTTPWWLLASLSASTPETFLLRGPGSYLSACPPKPAHDWLAQRLGRERLQRPYGLECPNGLTPLVKLRMAGPGDKVAFSAEGLRVNGVLLPQSKRQPDIPHWVQDGERVLGPDEVLVMGTVPRSFDSRYFGPVSLSAGRRFIGLF